jgi:hypothetical protein
MHTQTQIHTQIKTYTPSNMTLRHTHSNMHTHTHIQTYALSLKHTLRHTARITLVEPQSSCIYRNLLIDGWLAVQKQLNQPSSDESVITFIFLLPAYHRASKPVRSAFAALRLYLDSCYDSAQWSALQGVAYSAQWLGQHSSGCHILSVSFDIQTSRVPLLLTLGTVIVRSLKSFRLSFLSCPRAGSVIAQKVCTARDIQ